MGTYVLYFVLALNAIVSVAVPYVGIVVAYLFSILAPQYIWWWVFGDIRSSLLVLAPTLAGFVLSVLRGTAEYATLFTRTNLCVFGLWLFSVQSYFFGPFVDVVNASRFYDASTMFSLYQKTCLAYLVAVLLINNTQRLKLACLVLVLTTFYMTYWANTQYFVYHKFGRLGGPTDLTGHGIYTDQNNFAVLFVIGFPFIYFLGQYVGRALVMVPALMVVLFSWHAIFLTASRGALVGVGLMLLVYVLRERKKYIAFLVLAAFATAFAWQAGDVMKSRSATIANYTEESSAEDRIDEWTAALKMMADHPLTGVGFASFGQAFPYYSDRTPHVAHNTFFQLSAEWGVLAGFTYLALIFTTIGRLWANGKRLKRLPTSGETRFSFALNESCLFALVGFFGCSMFLSLQAYEVFYFLLVMANTLCFQTRDTELSGSSAPTVAPEPSGNIQWQIDHERNNLRE